MSVTFDNVGTQVWNDVLSIIKKELSAVAFSTWFECLTPVSFKNDVLYLEAPSELVINLINTMYLKYIDNALNLIGFSNAHAKILSANRKEKDVPDVFTPKNSSSFSGTESPLDEKFTFDRFVVGANSEFAYAASLAVAQSPSTKYNPLLIYGGTGLGKTHLIHSIGNYLKKSHPNWRVLYITSEKFTNDFVDALQKRTISNFRDKYRTVDALLIDDIQFFVNKERLQEEFFHTFNDLRNNGKQIVLTSDRPPKEISPLENRLRTRIEGGLLADIKAPDYETRLAILRKKLDLDEFKVSLPYEVIDLIATQIKSNIRELEGAVQKVVAYHEISHKDIDLSIASSILSDYFSTIENQHIDATMVIKAVQQYFNLSDNVIISSKRDRKYTYPRQIAMYICRELTDMSYPQIGSEFGGRDHSTVMHSINKIKAEIESNLGALNTINELIDKIKCSA